MLTSYCIVFTGHVGFCPPYVWDGFITDCYTTLMIAIRIYQKVKANVKMACVIKNFFFFFKSLTLFYQKKERIQENSWAFK